MSAELTAEQKIVAKELYLKLVQTCLEIAKKYEYPEWMINTMQLKPDIMMDMRNTETPNTAWFITAIQMSDSELLQKCLEIAEKYEYPDWMIETMLLEPELMEDMIAAKEPTKGWFMGAKTMYP